MAANYELVYKCRMCKEVHAHYVGECKNGLDWLLEDAYEKAPRMSHRCMDGAIGISELQGVRLITDEAAPDA